MYDGDIVKYENLTYIVYFSRERRGWFPFACGDGCGCCESEVTQPEYTKKIGNIYDNSEVLSGEFKNFGDMGIEKF